MHDLRPKAPSGDFTRREGRRRTRGRRRVDDARDHRPRALLRQAERPKCLEHRHAGPRVGLDLAPSGAWTRHLPSGCSPGSTASSDTASSDTSSQDTALLGWHDRPATLWMRRDRACTLTAGTPRGTDGWGRSRPSPRRKRRPGGVDLHAGTPPAALKGQPVKVSEAGDSDAKARTDGGEGQRPATRQRAPRTSLR
jgi:hypothetical protein